MSWTSLFRRSEVEGGPSLTEFIAGVSRIFEGTGLEETYHQVTSEIKQIFRCGSVAILVHDPDVSPGPDEGDWVLTVRAGEAEGARVCQRHATALPQVKAGVRLEATEELAHGVMLKALALAFEHDWYYGADVEDQVVLLRDPIPPDDLGSGDLSLIALPLTYRHRVGRRVETARVGVLALYKVPVQKDMQPLERFLRSLVGYAITTPICSLRDPVTGLYSERHLREELDAYVNMVELTKGKLGGAFVVGVIDSLGVYRQTLEAEGKVDPGTIDQLVSEVLRVVGRKVGRFARHYALGHTEYRCGFAGRIGLDGFGVVLPLLKPSDLRVWAVRLAQDVRAHAFPSEHRLQAGNVTVSLRVLLFGLEGTRTADEAWRLAERCIERLRFEQEASRRDATQLAHSIDSIEALLPKGQWEQVGGAEGGVAPPKRI